MTSKSVFAVVTTLIFLMGLVGPVEAKGKKPVPNISIKVKGVKPMSKKTTPKSHTSRKQMYNSAKAALKRGKSTLKTARSNLKAVKKSEARNRKLRTQSRSRYDQARYAHQANPTPKTKVALNKAYAAHMPVRQQHLNSVSALNSANTRVKQLKGFQQQAMGAMKMKGKLKPRNTAAPKFDRAAQFVRPKSAYDVVPAPQNIYSSSGLVQRLNTGTGAGERYTRGPIRQNAYNQSSFSNMQF